MKDAIFGFQRCWRWPKWAPDSRSWRMENSGKAIDSVSFTGWPDARVTPFLVAPAHADAPGGTGRQCWNTQRKPPARARWRAYRGVGPLRQGFWGRLLAEKRSNQAQKHERRDQPQRHGPGRVVNGSQPGRQG